MVRYRGISGKKRFLVWFQDGCEKYLSTNQLTIVIVEKSPAEKEPEVPINPDIPEEQVTLEKGYFHCVYFILHLNKDDSVDRKEEQAGVEQDPDEEEMEYVKIYDER